MYTLTDLIKMHLITRIAGILLALLLVTTTVRAQCPGPTLDGISTGDPTLCGGTVPGWSGPTTISFSIGTCHYKMDVCYRQILCYPLVNVCTWQVYVGNISSITGGCVFDNTVTDYLKNNPNLLFPNGYTPPPCGSPQYTPWVFKVFLASCWAFVQLDNDGTKHFIPCDNTETNCIMTRTLCSGTGGIEWGDPTYTSIGTPGCVEGVYTEIGQCFKHKCAP